MSSLSRALCLLLLPALAAAADDREGRVDAAAAVDAIFSEYDGPDSPGAAVGIYHGGRQVFAKGYGLSHLEHEVPITADTVFHVASVSKQFTAFMAALLAAEGKLELDGDVREMLDGVPRFGPPYSPITPRHLIHHTSGLRDQWSLFVLGGLEMDSRLRQKQVLQMLERQQALNFPTGSDYSYSNTGYTLLAELIAERSGQSFRAFAHSRVFEPLDMNATLFYDDLTELVENRAESYEKADGGEWRRSPLNYDNVGATSLHTTAGDLLKWAANFMQPTVGNGELIDTVSRMGKLDDGTPIRYGFGLAEKEIAGRRALLHTGSDAAYRAAFAVFPEDDFAVAILANTPMELLVQLTEITAAYLNPGAPRDAWRHDMPEVRPPSPTELMKFVGHYRSPGLPLMTIEQEEHRLVARRRNGDAEPLTFREDGSLDFGDEERIRGRHYRPQYGPDGDVVALEELGGNVVEGRYPLYQRIEPATPAAEELAAVAGDYRSPELDVTYTVTPDDGVLLIESIWSERPVRLLPTAADRYAGSWPMHDVAILRDAQGRPSALLVSSPRSRNVRLNKVIELEE